MDSKSVFSLFGDGIGRPDLKIPPGEPENLKRTHLVWVFYGFWPPISGIQAANQAGRT